MNVNQVIRNLVIRKGKYIASRAVYKSAMLCGQLSALAILLGIIYMIIDGANGVVGFYGYYLSGMLVCGLCIFLNRHEKYTLANVIFLINSNLLIYVFASNDTYTAGTYLYFIVCALMALALFGYQNKYISILFCLFSLGLFVLSYVYAVKISILTPEQQSLVHSESYIRTTFIFNFTIGLTLSVMIFLFLLKLNHHSEKQILLKNELLSKTNEELDRFVYSASHDLKAPLSSMLGLIEIAQLTNDPEEVKVCLQMMRGRIKNLDTFILEIINYSRNSRLALQKESFSLMDITKEVIDGLRYAEGFERIGFSYNFSPDLEVETDRARLRVVLNNLISNSLKYHDPSKQSPFVDIAATKRDQKLEIEIQDNGVGIAYEYQAKVFDMFFRASEQSTGSGLGLYIVKETIEKLDGNISLHSEIGRGTKFTIHLPLN